MKNPDPQLEHSIALLKRTAEAVYRFLGERLRHEVEIAMKDNYGDEIGDLQRMRDWKINYPSIRVTLELLGYRVGALEKAALVSSELKDSPLLPSTFRGVLGDSTASAENDG